METGQGSSGLRQAGGGLGVRTMAGFENWRVKVHLLTPDFWEIFGSFVLFSVGFNMVQWSQLLFGKRSTDTYEKMDERCHVGIKSSDIFPLHVPVNRLCAFFIHCRGCQVVTAFYSQL